MTDKSQIIENLKNVPEAMNTLAQFDEALSNALKNVKISLKLTFAHWASPEIADLEDKAFKIPTWDRGEFSAFSLVPLVQTTHYFANRSLVSNPKEVIKGDFIVSIEVSPNKAYNEINWKKLPWPNEIPVKAPLLRAYVHIVTEDSEEDFKEFFDNLVDYPEDVSGDFVSELPNVSGWAWNFDLEEFLNDQNALIEKLENILPKKA
jgi:hypothetical protein